MLTQESRDKPTPTWSIGLQQKLQKLLEKKSCSFGIMGKSLWEKKLFHKWEYEKKDKEERATSATSTLRSSGKCPQNPFLTKIEKQRL